LGLEDDDLDDCIKAGLGYGEAFGYNTMDSIKKVPIDDLDDDSMKKVPIDDLDDNNANCIKSGAPKDVYEADRKDYSRYGQEAMAYIPEVILDFGAANSSHNRTLSRQASVSYCSSPTDKTFLTSDIFP